MNDQDDEGLERRIAALEAALATSYTARAQDARALARALAREFAHTLNQPLGALTLSIETARRRGARDADRLDESLAKAEAQAERAIECLRSLRAQCELSREPLVSPVRDLLARLGAEFEVLASVRGIVLELKVDVEAGAEGLLEADPAVEDALRDLFIEHLEGPGRLEVEARIGAQGVEVEFRRAEDDSAVGPSATGVGPLEDGAIAAGFAQAHDGRVERDVRGSTRITTLRWTPSKA